MELGSQSEEGWSCSSGARVSAGLGRALRTPPEAHTLIPAVAAVAAAAAGTVATEASRYRDEIFEFLNVHRYSC